MIRLTLVVFMLLKVVGGFAQKELSFEEYKNKFPDKQAIILEKKEIVKITLGKNDSLDVSLSYYSEMLHLSDRTEGLAESAVSFSEFIQLSDLEAKTLVPVKNSYKTLKVSDYKTKNTSSGGIFFDDNQIKVFTYPGVQPGAKTILSYTQKFKEPRLLIPFYFNFYVPVVKTELTILVDKKLKLGHRLFNDKRAQSQFTESEDGNYRVYKWTAKELEEYISEDNAPSISYHEPHLVYFIEEINGKKRNEVFLKETKDLYSWYYSIAIKDQKVGGVELKNITDSIVKDISSPYEKTRKIFYWVQDHVKYVAFEEGYGGFVPRDANLVCTRRFGDCKDMANLLVQMLNLAGVKAYHVWIGTRDIPYSYTELPSTNVDNHMIAAVKINEQYIFLDATGRYTTLGYPTSMIQGKEALLGIDKGQYEIVKVPVMEADKNLTKDSIFCSIENGNTLSGSGKISINGYSKMNLTYMYNYTKKEEQKEFVKGICSKGSNKFSLMNYSVKDIESKDKSLKIDYSFQLNDYVKASANELYINLNLERPFDKEKIDTLKRKLPIEFEHKYIQEDVVVLDIPKGYTIEYLPSDSKVEDADLVYSISYRTVGSTIIYTKKYSLNTILLTKKDFYSWNKSVGKLSQAYREVIVLKQK